MQMEFRLSKPIHGVVLNAASAGEKVDVLTAELLGPKDQLLPGRLEELQSVLFSNIPGLPPPSQTDHLLLIIRPDMTGTAYVNELKIVATVMVNRAVEAGSPLFAQDITEVISVDLGVPVSPDSGVVVMRSAGWRRSLYWDFGPLNPELEPRATPLGSILAQQEQLLLGLTAPTSEAAK